MLRWKRPEASTDALLQNPWSNLAHRLLREAPAEGEEVPVSPRGLEKKSPPLPSLRWPSLPLCTLGVFCVSSSTISLYAKREAVEEAAAAAGDVCFSAACINHYRSRPPRLVVSLCSMLTGPFWTMQEAMKRQLPDQQKQALVLAHMAVSSHLRGDWPKPMTMTSCSSLSGCWAPRNRELNLQTAMMTTLAKLNHGSTL